MVRTLPFHGGNTSSILVGNRLFIIFHLFGGLKTKLDTLLLLGISNSGKSELVLDIVVKSYGLQNINFLSIDKKLNSEELSLYKDFRFLKEMLNLFDNLSFGEIFSINLVKQFIITSNYTRELLICLDNEALKNRVNKFIFNPYFSKIEIFFHFILTLFYYFGVGILLRVFGYLGMVYAIISIVFLDVFC